MALCVSYKFTALTADGAPLAGGKVYTYEPGSTTPKATYSERTLNTANTNPVILDSAGQADIYLDGLTKLLITTSADATVDTVDNVRGEIGYYDSPTFVDLTLLDDLTVTDDVTIGGDVTITGDLTCDDATLQELTISGLSVGAAANHNYGSAAVDWTLSASEMTKTYLTTTDDSASGAVNAIATATAGKLYIVRNSCGYALTIKASGLTGIVVANDRVAIVIGNGTDFVRVTADSAF